MLSVRAIFRCPWMFWTCSWRGNKDWCVSLFCVPKPTQEYNIYHSKLRMYFHNFNQSPKKPILDDGTCYKVFFLIDCIHSFRVCALFHRQAGSVIDLSEMWCSPRGKEKNNSPKVLVSVKWSHFLSQHQNKWQLLSFARCFFSRSAFLHCAAIAISVYTGSVSVPLTTSNAHLHQER